MTGSKGAMHRVATASMVLAMLSLAACGRAGPLEPPPAAVADAPADAGEADAPRNDRPFILDGLLQ